jgi:stage III sporulation protein AG
MEYKENIESQLEDIISQISGVGNVKVLITVSGTKELIYAEQSEVSRRTDSGSEDLSQKSEIILADENNENQPVVKKIITPEICGAIVVCEGASDAKTKERVVNALMAALGIGSSKISVEPM